MTFDYTGAAQTWTVPAGVTEATFDVFGAEGADLYAPAGLGGEATATFQVHAGDVFQVMVGGQGSQSPASGAVGAGGFNGGGDSLNNKGGGGGGASDVRSGTCAADSSCGLDNRVVVAGGGGGGGGGSGGDGGGLTGDDGEGAGPGQGGSQTAGGLGSDPSVNDGAFGLGGVGIGVSDGGGGGGGWYGGGGGGTGGLSGGGGGGSGHVDTSALASSMGSGVRSGDGEVLVTYSLVATAAAAPLVLTTPASGVTATAAMLNGVVDPQLSSTSYHFEYGPDTHYGSSTPAQQAGSGSDLVLAQTSLSGLEPGKEYHFRLVATNAGGTVEGPEQTFTTRAAAVVPAPTATTSPASGVSTTTATLNGVVNPQGEATSYHFEYGTSPTSYESSTPDQDAGSGSSGVAVSAPLTGLQPGTSYHYRLVATSSGGTSDGDDAHFTTDTGSTPPNLAPDPDFEQTPDPYSTNGPGQFSWTSDQARSGTHSLKIVGSGGGLSRWLSKTRAIAVSAGSYTACAYLKTQAVNTPAYLAVNYWTAAGTYIPATTSTPTRLTGDSTWTQLCITTQAPAGAATLRLEFRLPDRGTLWIDDTSVTRTP